MKKLIFIVLILSACNQNNPKRDEDYRYEITFTFGAIGYYYDCDTYTHKGNSYTLFRNGKVFKSFESGSGVLVEVEDRFLK